MEGVDGFVALVAGQPHVHGHPVVLGQDVARLGWEMVGRRCTMALNGGRVPSCQRSMAVQAVSKSYVAGGPGEEADAPPR